MSKIIPIKINNNSTRTPIKTLTFAKIVSDANEKQKDITKAITLI